MEASLAVEVPSNLNKTPFPPVLPQNHLPLPKIWKWLNTLGEWIGYFGLMFSAFLLVRTGEGIFLIISSLLGAALIRSHLGQFVLKEMGKRFPIGTTELYLSSYGEYFGTLLRQSLLILLVSASQYSNTKNANAVTPDGAIRLGELIFAGLLAVGLSLDIPLRLKAKRLENGYLPQIRESGRWGIFAICSITFFLLAGWGINKNHEDFTDLDSWLQAKWLQPTNVTYTGKKRPYTIVLSSFWHPEKPIGQDTDLFFSLTQNIGFIVAYNEVQIDSDSQVQNVEALTLKTFPDAKFKTFPDTIIDGRTFKILASASSANDNGITYVSISYLYSGEEGTFHLTGLIPSNLVKKYQPEIVKAASSFKFPK